MSPRTKKQNIEIREATRQKIIDAALKLFADRGYHTTSVSMISEKAGVSKGSVYNYFESKEDLLKCIVFWGIETLMASFDLDRDGILTKEEMVHFIRESFRLVKQHKKFWKFYYSIIYQPSVMQLFGEDIFKKYNFYAKVVTGYFNEHGASDPEIEMRFFTALMDGIALSYIMDPGHFPVEAMEKKVLGMYSCVTK